MKRAALALVALALPGVAGSWPAAVHEKSALLAVQLMPPALAGQLNRHRDELLEGVRIPDRVSTPESHALHADGSAGSLDRDVAARVAQAVAHVRSQGSFRELARMLGEIAHLAADATYPLNTSETAPREREYYADYGAYSASRLEKFPPVFGGYEPHEGFDPAAYVRLLSERANRGYPLIAESYLPGGGALRSSRTFDDRGPAFGIAQIGFGSAVTGTANLWLHVWREAHGDLTNTPYYPPARRVGLAPDRARPPQRF